MKFNNYETVTAAAYPSTEAARKGRYRQSMGSVDTWQWGIRERNTLNLSIFFFNSRAQSKSALVIKLGQAIITTSLLTKFGDNRIENGQLSERTRLILSILLFKGHAPEVSGSILLVIEYGRDIITTNIITKFCDNWTEMANLADKADFIKFYVTQGP